jgi:hypothetical protein
VGNGGVAPDAVVQHCDEMRYIHTSFILALKENGNEVDSLTGYRKYETCMKF